MDVGVLYSGGKDSSLACLLLEPFCSVTALCCTFGVTSDFEHATAAARAVNLPSQVVDLDPAVAHEAADRIVSDGYPREGIQQVHEHALNCVAELQFDAVADGTRRDDRVPTVHRRVAQSLEDRWDVFHLAPLAGYGWGAIDSLVTERLEVETGPSETLSTGDYEAELRSLIEADYGAETVESVFPDHTQSRVLGRRE